MHAGVQPPMCARCTCLDGSSATLALDGTLPIQAAQRSCTSFNQILCIMEL